MANNVGPNNRVHSCEECDGECMSWAGYHGNVIDVFPKLWGRHEDRVNVAHKLQSYEEVAFRDSDIFDGGYGS